MKSMTLTTKDLMLLFTILSGFIFAVSFSSYYINNLIHEGKVCSCFIPVPLLIMTMSSLGFFVGGIASYYFLRRIIGERKETKINAEKSLNFLEGDEKIIIKQIIQKQGEIMQSSITGLTRVRTTRAIKKLESKQIIIREKKGMTNKIILDKQIMSLFKN
ncbi:MAG: hypothetical protein GON13_03705 [Nanoarchaeota archaeon]|nr:hypothetical protein [Nanoarchaeota archaeon]